MTSAKNSVLEPPNLKIFWGRTPRDPPYKACASARAIMPPRYKKSSFGPVYASWGNPPYWGLLGYFDREVSLRTRKGEKNMLLPFLSPLKQERDTCTGDLTVPDEFSIAWKIWPDISFIRDFELLDVWFLCTVQVVPCEQKTLTRKLVNA